MRILLCLAVILGAVCRPAAAEEAVPAGGRAIRVASVIYEPVKWDKDANLRRLDALVREAHRRGARLIVTPEGALEGYVVNEVIQATGPTRRELTARFAALAEPCDGSRIAHFQELCKELDVYLVLGFLEAAADRTYNTAILIGPEGAIVGKYRKTHFAQGYSVGDRKGDNPPGYTRGAEYPVFDVDSAKLGIMICYDRRVPEVAARLAAGGAQFIVNPAYGMSGDCNRRYLSARAKETGLPILLVHPKQTVFSTADGEVRIDVRPQADEDRIHVVSINPSNQESNPTEPKVRARVILSAAKDLYRQGRFFAAIRMAGSKSS